MNSFTVLDIISGIGCIFYASTFLTRKIFFLPERRLMLLLTVLGLGFLFRGLNQIEASQMFVNLERFTFIALPLSMTLYVEKMAKLKLNIYFKLFILLGLVVTPVLYLFSGGDLRLGLLTLFLYEMITIVYLCIKVFRVTIKLRRGVQFSINVALLIFIVVSTILIFVDWYNSHILHIPRFSSAIVFPFCYIAVLMSYSSDGFSVKKLLRAVSFDLAFMIIQISAIKIIIPSISWYDLIVLVLAFIYMRMITKTVSVIFRNTENKKAYFALERVNKLSRIDNLDTMVSEIQKIDNIKSAKVFNFDKMKEIGLDDSSLNLLKERKIISRREIELSTLKMDDFINYEHISICEYMLDAFNADFISLIEGSEHVLSIEFEKFSLDRALNEKALAISTQTALCYYKSRGQM